MTLILRYEQIRPNTQNTVLQAIVSYEDHGMNHGGSVFVAFFLFGGWLNGCYVRCRYSDFFSEMAELLQNLRRAGTTDELSC